jgi:hypothetical protein
MVNAASKLVGLFAAAAVGGDVSLGSELAGNAQSYNRKLHSVEKEMLVAEADKLDKQGKSASGLSWDTLLNLVAGADVDAVDTARLTAVLATSGDSNPEKVRLLEDLQLAESVINKLKSEKIQLTWADGTPIVAHGDGVYAFASSTAQYNDSSLFNTNQGNSTSGDDFGSIPVDWVNQFGPSAALQHQNEIGSIGTSTWQNQDAYQQMTTILGGGIVRVTTDLDIALAMAGGLGAKGVLGLLGELRGTKLAGESAEDILASGGAKDLKTNLSEVWTLKPTQRGIDIESYLAKTEYSARSGWYNVGAERNGFFPLVDFQNGNTLVSLKSVDTAGSTWLSRMQNHIIDLGTNGAKVNGTPANMVLDLRVQPGGSAAAKSLIEFGREYNVKVVVKEFK